MSKLKFWNLGLLLSASVAMAYDWTIPGSVSQEYHPGVQHSRGIVEDFDLVQQSLNLSPVSSEDLVRVRLGQQSGLASQGLYLDLSGQYQSITLGLLSEWRQNRSSQGLNQGLADPWLYLGWSTQAGQSQALDVQAWYQAPLTEDTDVNAPNMSKGSQSFGLSSRYQMKIQDHLLGLQALYIYSGESDKKIAQGSRILTRSLSEGHWTSLGLTHEYQLKAEHSIGSQWSWQGMWGGQLSIGAWQADFANYQALKWSPHYRYQLNHRSQIQLGMDMTVAESIDTPNSNKWYVNWTIGWGGSQCTQSQSAQSKSSSPEPAKIEPVIVPTPAPAPAPAVVSAPAPEVSEAPASPAPTPAAKSTSVEPSTGLGERQPAPVITFTVEEPTEEEKKQIEKKRKAREAKRLKKLKEELKKAQAESQAKPPKSSTKPQDQPQNDPKLDKVIKDLDPNKIDSSQVAPHVDDKRRRVELKKL